MATVRSLRLFIVIFLSAALLLVACSSTPTTETPRIQIELLADGEQQSLEVPLGSTVRLALEQASLVMGPLDRTEPSLSTQLEGGDEVRVLRVSEEFEIETETLPFTSRTVRNESLTEGEQRLIQAGVSGVQETTYRLLFEDGELVTRSEVSTHIVEAPVDEIIMIGVQAPSTAQPIQGRLAYLSAGNAWLIEGNTGQRRAIVTSGDLDGRIFSVSPDGGWLLFTRSSDAENQINTLWVASLDEDSDVVVSLRATNIVHYAGWAPGREQLTVAYSTVEATDGPPGWTANNDLWEMRFTPAGTVFTAEQILEPRTDSLYNWWGSTYAWSPNGAQLAFTRPDAVGLVLTEEDDLDILHELLPFQTESEWAWMPGASWTPDGGSLLFANHAEQAGLEIQERSPLFDVVAMDTGSGALQTLVEGAGMFAQPQASPQYAGGYLLAYLQALSPTQSDVSDYQLMLAEADGGEAQRLFPPLGALGLQPQAVSWSPAPLDADGSLYIALNYYGNLWLVDVFSGATLQLTADGLVSALSWGD